MTIPTKLEINNDTSLQGATCFIEQQFPVSKLSKESYSERRANQGQTITSLGKWWGRKPLVLVRAALLGILLPTSNDLQKDKEIFLKLMTMDRDGLWSRKRKSISKQRILEELLILSPNLQQRFLEYDNEGNPYVNLLGRSQNRKERLQRLIFDRMSYAEKLNFCARPEEIEGPSESAWTEINAHLNTNASSLSELVSELGTRRFGHPPRVGDAFCGGGSIPFEAARLGCDVYGSDLNPVAALLSWATVHIVGGRDDIKEKVTRAQRDVYDHVDQQLCEWGIEHNSMGWRADAYLYCVEVIDPESGWKTPLLPSLAIGEGSKTIVRLVPDDANKCYNIEVIEDVFNSEFELAKNSGTVQNSRLNPPNNGPSTPIEVLRKDLRLWEQDDLTPRPDDVFQERLYCIRWVETYKDERGREQTRRYYRSPTAEDLQREQKVLELLRVHISDWKEKGYIPTRRIESGEKTDELTRTRGWTYWHQLFTPRQLLILGLLQEKNQNKSFKIEKVGNLLGIGRYADWNSKLSRWGTGAARESIGQTFSNQALNTMYSYANKAFPSAAGNWFINIKGDNFFQVNSYIQAADCRQIENDCDIWITDPPYADAVNYHELSEFFLSWYEKPLKQLFPYWYVDSKRALAVRGDDDGFRQAMVECYKRLAEKMPPNGVQIVLFTHQDAAIWADMTMILWASGLRVTAAWTIQTEREAAGLRTGNYVQGTVLLVLRKRTESEPIFLDEISYLVEIEVKRQLDSMLSLEDDSDPSFGDTDYQLAAYAAALRVLTKRPLYEIDPERELLRQRRAEYESPVEKLIRHAVRIACDHLVPRNLNSDLWRQLDPMERFYLKGLEMEGHGENRNGVYQEMARGFGAVQYDDLLANARANETRLKRASEFGRRNLSGEGFSNSLTRQCLFAIYQTAKTEETQTGLNYLKTELPDYWLQREKIIHLLDFLSRLPYSTAMQHWSKDSHAAGLLLGAVQTDHV